MKAETQGFTLVELLAAMLAGSILLVALGWALSALGMQLQRSDAREDTRRDSQAGATLAALLERAQVPDAAAPVVTLQPNGVRLPVLAPDALAPGKVVTLDLEVRDRNGAKALVASFEGPGLAQPAHLPSPVTLLEGLRRAAFSGEGGDATRRGLPEVISFAWQDASGEDHLVAARPRASAGGACRFDPISQSCRP